MQPDPDGEAVPTATNDEVQEAKFPLETADGTGKMGSVSQIVADYLQKSAGFYTEVRPYYIVRPAIEPSVDRYVGTLFYTAIDDGGLSDAVNITIGINGVGRAYPSVDSRFRGRVILNSVSVPPRVPP